MVNRTTFSCWWSYGIVFLSIINNGAISLKITSFIVPLSADPRYDKPEMTCRYEFGAEGLYTVKWYKDDREFYRYLPTYDPQIIRFPADDVTLSEGGFVETKTTLEKRRASPEVCNTTACTIRLVNITEASTGEYSCEISSERPYFNTDIRHENFTVIALPKSAPTIEGISMTYSSGDLLSATCTTDASLPQSVIRWYINGRRPPREGITTFGSGDSDIFGIRRSTSELQFRIEEGHFKEDNAQMKVTCEASIPDTEVVKVAHVAATMAGHQGLALDNQKLEWNSGCENSANAAILFLLYALRKILESARN